ncbi:hypothetical protein [Streptomyces sp. NPDC006510]|uniref:hypothetical protein n=1 Tax=Streptomyces sp. NPDC006510 TaxID=3155600 RepID=UPI0033B5A40B
MNVTRLDRLSRSVLHLAPLGAELRAHRIGLHVLTADHAALAHFCSLLQRAP